MENSRHPNIINEEELQWKISDHGENFASGRKILGAATGASQFGCSLYEVKPGKRAFPYHAHASNEESIYVLEGEGTLRLGKEGGEDSIPLKKGDYITLPASLDMAHQLINSGEKILKYLCFSTLKDPEVVRYPDSNKVGMLTSKAPAHWPNMRGHGFKLLKDTEGLDYYQDE